jgi:orotidine-5'-phosphate decarboxylase
MSSIIYLAVDTPRLDDAVTLVNRVHNHIGGVKLGLEFFCANGHHGVREVAKCGLPIFLDLKLHDIPNTVGKAMQALSPLEPAIVTVHAAGGRAMLEDAKAAAGTHTKVVAVTVLTSLDADDLSAVGIDRSPADQVERLAELARIAGLDGIVCSGAEVGRVRSLCVRPASGALGDQKRAVTPRAARDAGASILVVGRPISMAPDPDIAAREIEATL